jgi:hypothetical protein
MSSENAGLFVFQILQGTSNRNNNVIVGQQSQDMRVRDCENDDGKECEVDMLSIIGHDGKEFLLVNLAVLVQVKLVYHCLPRSG